MQARRPLESVYEDERVCLGVRDDLVVAVWRDAPQMLQMQRYREVVERIAAAHPTSAVGLSVVVSGTPTFSNEVRSAVAEMVGANLLPYGLAHVILVRGLVGAAVRAFLSTAILLGRGKQPTKVFDGIEPAAQWLAERMRDASTPWSARDLVAVVGEFVAQSTPRSASD